MMTDEAAAVSAGQTDDDEEEAVPVPPPEISTTVQNTENDVESTQSSAVKMQSTFWRWKAVVCKRITHTVFPFTDKSLPKKIRVIAGICRGSYVIWNILQLIFLFQCKRSWLYKTYPHEFNTGTCTTLFYLVLLCWAFFFNVQGSDPGYLTPETIERFKAETLKQRKERRQVDPGPGANSSSDEEELTNEVEQLLTEHDDVLAEFDEENDADSMVTLLRSLQDAPLRAAYDKRSDRIVAKFDHFCHVIGTSIGERNHAAFWWFLLAQTLVLLFGLMLACSSLRFYPHDYITNVWKNGWEVANVVTIGLSFLAAAGLFGFHTFLACGNHTTHELAKTYQLSYLKGFGPCDLPFSKGACTNFYSFLIREPGFTWGEWSPVRWEKPGAFDRDSTDVCSNCWENKYWKCC